MSEDGSRIAILGTRGELAVWDLPTLEKRFEVGDLNGDASNLIEFCSDGKFLAVASPKVLARAGW